MQRIIFAFIAVFLSPVGCFPSDSGTAQSTDALTGIEKDFWNESQLNVCFETRENAYQQEYALVEKAVKVTWESALSSSLKFVFLSQACGAVGSSTPRHIRIQVDNAARPNSYVGSVLRDKPNGMILNFLFTGWETSYCTANEYHNSSLFGLVPRRHFCIMAIAIHEFGHALGFSHENQREDTPKACLEDLRKNNDNPKNVLVQAGMLNVSPYDKDSIMNYCNPKWNNDGILSACDRYAVAKVYRKYDDIELARQCMKSTGVCMDVTPPGSPQYTCQQQLGWGKCNEPWMKGFCEVSCGVCSGRITCDDVPPPGAPYTCQQQRSWGKCKEKWMFGSCRRTCGVCK